MKYETKQKMKKWAVYIGALLAIVAMMTFVGKVTNGFTTFDKDDLNFEFIHTNENNLITPDVFEKDTYKTDTSVLIKQKDGILRLSGKPDKNGNAVVAELGKIKLPADTYTFTTGKDGVNNNTNGQKYQMALNDGLKDYFADTDKPITLVADTEMTITVVVQPGVDVSGVKLYPVLVPGDTVEGFYKD